MSPRYAESPARSHSKVLLPSRDRWLVSYADFITLLFALFVVLFAASYSDKEKVQTFAQAVENAIEHSSVQHAPRFRQPKGAPEPVLNSTYAALVQSLEPEVKNHQARVWLDSRGLVITLNQTAFFHSGEEEFDPEMYPTLEKIATALVRIDNPIRMEGHTDSLPIHNERFRNNWELSSARSIAVLELLATRFGIPPARMSVAGYADTAPVSTNDTEEGRARNRRVDIVVLSGDGLSKEPGGTP
jgi:chemotaxis protein MotB